MIFVCTLGALRGIGASPIGPPLCRGVFRENALKPWGTATFSPKTPLWVGTRCQILKR